jgi:ATP-dependent RNA helicase SUPV3L1/SUV3
VQTRLELWLKTHIEKLLGPLFDLAKAEDVTGIGRGIAFQLIEALGVLERSKIAAEMKDLDQPSRASLRKYGVRFGAYHIYIPPLLKPAARALASLLWAQKQDNVDMSALSGAQHLAGSGRTSFPVDKVLDRDAYRVLGYRQCGERAVRVDILERLADLIRPALSWREASPAAKPPGVFDGRGFVVTQAMTSLTGSAGEDFASILRALGYRMDRRPPLPPKPVVVEAPAAEAGQAEAPPEASENTAATDAIAAALDAAGIAHDTPGISEELAAPSATLLPDVAFASAAAADEPVEAPASAEANTTEAPVSIETSAIEAPPDAAASTETAAPTPDQPAAETATETAVAGDAAAADTGTIAATPETPAVPEMVEVWRPGGRSEERRPRHDRNRHRPQAAQDGAQPVAAGEAGEGAKRERHRGGRRDRNNDFRKLRADAPAATAAPGADGAPVVDGAPAPERRDDRPRQRFHDRDKAGDRDKGREGDKPKGKFGGGRDKGGRDKGGRGDKGGRDKRPDGGPSHRQYATTAPPRERDRPIDPNSPFAKLAALKEQLTANRKDR